MVPANTDYYANFDTDRAPMGLELLWDLTVMRDGAVLSCRWGRQAHEVD